MQALCKLLFYSFYMKGVYVLPIIIGIDILHYRRFTQDPAEGKQFSAVYCVYMPSIGSISNLYHLEIGMPDVQNFFHEALAVIIAISEETFR